MIRYKLVNEDRGSSIIARLHSYLESDLSAAFRVPIEAENLGCSNVSELGQQLMDKYDSNFNDVSACNSNQSTEQLNSFLTDDTLSLEEAIFCLLGLNMEFIPSNFSFQNIPNNDCILDSIISSTSEYRKLTKAINAMKETRLVLTSNNIYTIGFVAWALKKGFIKQLGESTQNSKKNNNVIMRNTRLREIRQHNTDILVDRYSLQLEKLTMNAFVMDDKHYNTYKDQLLPLPATKKKPEGLPERRVLYTWLRTALNQNK